MEEGKNTETNMNRPLKKWMDRGCEVTAWPGKFGPRFSTRKSYKDKKDGTYKISNSLFDSDLRVFMQLFKDALDWSNEQQGRAREQEVPDTFSDPRPSTPTASGSTSVRPPFEDEAPF